MKKKIYNSPLCEVANIRLGGTLLSSVPDPHPIPPVAPVPPRGGNYLSE